jgi:hypothetical protein
MMPVMLPLAETQERRPAPATGKAEPRILNAENHDDEQHKPALSSESAHCLWCGRAFTPRTSGGSPQRFCSTGHRQAFWVAARRWIMKAIHAGLLSTECLKVP